MSTIGDDLLREASPAFGPRIEALVVYNSNPVAVAPDSAKVVRGFAREDLFTVVLEHFLTDTADHADIVLPATTQLEHWDAHTAYGHTYALLNRAGRGAAGPGEVQRRRSSARWPRAWASPSPASPTATRPWPAGRLRARPSGRLRRPARARLGRLQVPRRRLPTAASPPPAARRRRRRPVWACPTSCPTTRARRRRRRWRRAYPLAMISPPARHFLNSSFVNVTSLRAAEGEPLLEMHPQDAAARGIASGAIVRVFNDRGATSARPRSASARGPGVVNGLGIWWRKFGLNGTNVNELTHQRLTDIGRAPTFYDCLVEVAAA
jgi:anaerobic selenocysteine-containing dehydrogenase